ncbi:MAG: hypothetical protein J6033_05535, partial [Lachnospiraceae bacterium]|nr:hypothetical protein [Lachnospiraceae bacterium]
MSDKKDKKDNYKFAHMSWAIPIVALCIYPPIGVILTILKLVDSRIEKQDRERRKNKATRLEDFPNLEFDKDNNFKVPVSKEERAREDSRRTSIFTLRKVGMFAAFIIGGILALAAGTTILEEFQWMGEEWYWESTYSFMNNIVYPLFYGFGGLFLIKLSRNIKKYTEEQKNILTVIGDKDNISISLLQQITGLEKSKLIKILEDAISHNLFGSSAFIDKATDTLVIRGPLPERPVAETEVVDGFKKQEASNETEYQRILRELHEVNEAIPGEEMTAKINKL